MTLPKITGEEFRAMTWETFPDGQVKAHDPKNQPYAEHFAALLKSKDPEKLRDFIENVLGEKWIEDPFPVISVE